MDLKFLTSNRFWAMIIAAVSYYLQSKGILGSEEMVLIATIAGGFVGVRTFDRAAEKLGGTDKTE